jgi:hypothetical protein
VAALPFLQPSASPADGHGPGSSSCAVPAGHPRSFPDLTLVPFVSDAPSWPPPRAATIPFVSRAAPCLDGARPHQRVESPLHIGLPQRVLLAGKPQPPLMPLQFPSGRPGNPLLAAVRRSRSPREMLRDFECSHRASTAFKCAAIAKNSPS